MIKYYHIKTKEDAKIIPKELGKKIIEDGLKEGPWSNGDFNDKYIDLLLYLFLEAPDTKQRGLFIAMDESVYVGVLAAMVNPGTLVKQANELMWNVIPSYREQGVGLNLMQMYGDWAKGLGLNKVSMSHYGDSDHLKKFYEDNGFKQTEITYVKDLD